MEEYNCRTCFTTTNRKRCVQVTKKCYLEKSLRDVITYLVPEMEPTLSDDELVCMSCVRTLKLVMKFILGCLEVESIRNQSKEFDDNDGDLSDSQDNMLTADVEIKSEGVDCYEEHVDEVYYKEYEDDDGSQNKILSSDSRKKIKLDHDYLNKQNSAQEKSEDTKSNFVAVKKIEYQYDSNVEYESVDDEAVYDNSEALEGEESVDHTNYNRPIEIVYDDSLIMQGPKEEGDEGHVVLDQVPEDGEYEEYQDDGSIEDDEKDILACSTCNEVFTSNEEYKEHLKIHPPYKCQYCEKSLNTEIEYKSHILWHKEKGFRMCEFCGRCFKASGTLKMHIANMHEDENIYTCEHCPKQYKHKFKLDSHVRTVHLKIGRQQCQECQKTFQTKEACENHYRLIHLQIKPFVCDVCGIEFGRKDYLQKHMLHHNGEASSVVRAVKNKESVTRSQRIRLRNPGTPVICRVCGKQIKTVHLLKAHLQTHVRIKRHKCKFCELTFTLSTNRDRHEKLHESDPDNKFRCNICWKRVKTEEDLERHIAGHGNRPPQHSCEICGEKFHRRYLVDNHLLDKHTGPGDIEKAEEEIVFKNLLEYVDPKVLD